MAIKPRDKGAAFIAFMVARLPSLLFSTLRISALASTTLGEDCSRYIRASERHPPHSESHAHNNLSATDGSDRGYVRLGDSSAMLMVSHAFKAPITRPK